MRAREGDGAALGDREAGPGEPREGPHREVGDDEQLGHDEDGAADGAGGERRLQARDGPDPQEHREGDDDQPGQAEQAGATDPGQQRPRDPARGASSHGPTYGDSSPRVWRRARLHSSAVAGTQSSSGRLHSGGRAGPARVVSQATRPTSR